MLDISDLVKDCKFQSFFWVLEGIKPISIAIIMLCHCALKVCYFKFEICSIQANSA